MVIIGKNYCPNCCPQPDKMAFLRILQIGATVSQLGGNWSWFWLFRARGAQSATPGKRCNNRYQMFLNLGSILSRNNHTKISNMPTMTNVDYGSRVSARDDSRARPRGYNGSDPTKGVKHANFYFRITGHLYHVSLYYRRPRFNIDGSNQWRIDIPGHTRSHSPDISRCNQTPERYFQNTARPTL